MPRSADSGTELYFSGFDSLAELDGADLEPDARARSVPCPVLPRTGSRVLICHDNSGRSPFNDCERRWTFEHWSLTTDFCFFSHRRVTIPPPAWTIAAHRHGTRSLGTLIFEGSEGAQDAIRLVTRPADQPGSTLLRLRSGPRGSPFDALSHRYMDRLIDLCLLLGFDGFLLNFEIELGERDGMVDERGRPKRRFAREHASALCAWVETFRIELEKRVPGGTVLWYDSVTSLGDLQWQCRLTPLNTPFFLACGNMFLDYHWRPEWLLDLPHVVRNIARQSPVSAVHRRQAIDAAAPTLGDVFVGIDVYGRGMPGGGGYDTHIALEYISRSSKDLSIAFFAPAWTRDELSGPRNEPWAVWEADDAYFWRGGTNVPDSVARERSRRDEEEDRLRREKDLPPRTIPRPPFQSVSALVAAAPIAATSSFFTTFARGGSDNAFRLEGKDVMRGPWTDVSVITPSADRVAVNDELASLTSNASWLAGHSILVLPISEASLIPLCSVNVSAETSRELIGTIIWQCDDTTVQPHLLLEIEAEADSHGSMQLDTSLLGSSVPKALANGWRQSRFRLSAWAKSRVTRLSLSMPVTTHVLHLGAISLRPASDTPDRFTIQPAWRASARTQGGVISWQFSTYAHLFAVVDDSGEILGTTAHPSQYLLPGSDAPTSRLHVAAVCTDGSIVSSDALNVSA